MDSPFFMEKYFPFYPHNRAKRALPNSIYFFIYFSHLFCITKKPTFFVSGKCAYLTLALQMVL
jgi:hypothetical protein